MSIGIYYNILLSLSLYYSRLSSERQRETGFLSRPEERKELGKRWRHIILFVCTLARFIYIDMRIKVKAKLLFIHNAVSSWIANGKEGIKRKRKQAHNSHLFFDSSYTYVKRR